MVLIKKNNEKKSNVLFIIFFLNKTKNTQDKTI